jgi:hypothetical protein
MPNHKKAIIERIKIVSRSEKRRYGANFFFQVIEKTLIGVEHVTILLDDGAYATLAPARQASWEGGQRFSIKLEGFPTATLAEENGRRLVQGLLWSSINLNFGVKLNYTTHEPTTVYDRLQSGGMSSYGEMTSSFPPMMVIDKIREGYILPTLGEKALLLSMEMYCAAHLEASDRAKFLLIVSAIEPLANTERLGPEVDSFVKDCLNRLHEYQNISVEVKQSLQGRLYGMQKASIRQSIKKLIRSRVPEDHEAPAIIDEAYGLRSQLIHEGVPADLDVDYSEETKKVASILKKVYAKELGLNMQGV